MKFIQGRSTYAWMESLKTFAFSVLVTGIFHKPTLSGVGALNYSVYLFALFINRVFFFLPPQNY